MNQFIGETDQRWRDLDGQKVLFRRNFRPNARYLYFTYCIAILRKSWNKDKPTTALNDELGKPYWGTTGRYIKKNMLQGFVQELGHDYEALLEGAISDSSNKEEMGLAALEAANDQIKVSVRGEDGLLYEHGSGSDDEGEDDSNQLGTFCLLGVGHGRANVNSGNAGSMEWQLFWYHLASTTAVPMRRNVVETRGTFNCIHTTEGGESCTVVFEEYARRQKKKKSYKGDS